MEREPESDEALGASEVMRQDARGGPEPGLVRLGDSFLLGLEGLDAVHRPEQLLIMATEDPLSVLATMVGSK